MATNHYGQNPSQGTNLGTFSTPKQKIQQKPKFDAEFLRAIADRDIAVNVPNEQPIPNQPIRGKFQDITTDANGMQATESSRDPFSFRAPSEDLNQPAFNRVDTVEPELRTFSPDDARYAQRQAQIAERDSRSQAKLRSEIANREKADVALKVQDRKVAAEDRIREHKRQDIEDAYKADLRARELKQMDQEMARRNQWSASHGGIPWSAQSEQKWNDYDQKQSITTEFESTVRQINSDEDDIKQDLLLLESGGVPKDPNTTALIEQVTGKRLGGSHSGFSKGEIERVRTYLTDTAARERGIAQEKMNQLLGHIRTTVRQTDDNPLE